MLSSSPMPENPWPRNMLITIDDPSPLFELLWVREAWGLQPTGADLPPLLVDTPATVSSGHPPAEWSEGWYSLWGACVTHAARPQDRVGMERLFTDRSLGVSERAALLSGFLGPSWRERFGDEAITGAYAVWQSADAERRMSAVLTLDETPEHLALDSLIPAWRAGLTTLVVIPCRGSYTRRIGASALLLTDETRNDPARFAEALGTFAG
ncbi:MAG: hypothetical protein ABWX66_02350 [Lacisediminihabitans sp.]